MEVFRECFEYVGVLNSISIAKGESPINHRDSLLWDQGGVL